MYDKDLVREILTQVYEATQKILNRFEPIRSSDDFTNSEAGMEKCPFVHCPVKGHGNTHHQIRFATV